MNTETDTTSDFYTALVEVYHLPLKYSPKLDKYFLLHWEPQYLLSKWRSDGTIIRQNMTYHIVNRTRADIESWAHDLYIRLSFRKSADRPTGFVIIRRAKT